ncbi:hypothetical protein [Caballeronia ptereochthonis]|nr:hypothetical protein [Caballeronia ptereochthonis]
MMDVNSRLCVNSDRFQSKSARKDKSKATFISISQYNGACTDENSMSLPTILGKNQAIQARAEPIGFEQSMRKYLCDSHTVFQAHSSEKAFNPGAGPNGDEPGKRGVEENRTKGRTA